MFRYAVILAGGEGSRMKPLTDYIPKPLVKVEGLHLVEHVIYFLRANNISNIFTTYGYKGEMLLENVAKEVEGFINTSGRDNAYFLFNSIIKYINEPIVVCPCDMITNLDLEAVYEDYIKLGSPAACIVPVNTLLDADSIIVENNKVRTITRSSRMGLYASGVQILNPHRINELITPENNFYQVWNNLIEVEQLYATLVMPTQWKIFDRLKDLP